MSAFPLDGVGLGVVFLDDILVCLQIRMKNMPLEGVIDCCSFRGRLPMVGENKEIEVADVHSLFIHSYTEMMSDL
jgi:hypothetical protein